jgi:hypothetical protein
MVKSIIVIPDLLRETRAFPEALFDLIKEPILQGCGIEIGEPIDRVSAQAKSFNLEEFRRLAGADTRSWASCYFQVPEPATAYLKRYIETIDLVVSFEMPPWLSLFCIKNKIPFLDFRVSPLRFGRDLYIAFRCSQPSFSERVSDHLVTQDELRLEAAILSANVRMHQRRLRDERGYRFTSLEGGIVVIGQAPYDASVIAPDRQQLRFEDFSDQVRALCKERNLLYKPHPKAAESAPEEIARLRRIIGKAPTICLQNAYQILSTREDVELLGISSGLLQEAQWFGKTSHTLFQHFVPLAYEREESELAYQQIHFRTLLSPQFWHQFLSPEREAPRLASLPAVAHHHARETFDHWWDYSKVLLWERSFPIEAFTRSGGGLVHERLARVEHELVNAPITNEPGITGSMEEEATLPNQLSINLYSRLVKAYTSVDQAIAVNATPSKYEEKVLDAAYYQALHDKNLLFQRNNWLMPYATFIANQQYTTVREVGCGNGAFIKKIAESVPRVIGLDWARSPNFPQGHNIEFCHADLTTSILEYVDLNCSADLLEHIKTEELLLVLRSLHTSSRFNFHVIACYDDGHSHLSIFPPDVWLYLFRQQSADYHIRDLSIRHDDANHVVCVITNLQKY